VARTGWRYACARSGTHERRLRSEAAKGGGLDANDPARCKH
jgi:hypothetical protein